MSGVPLSIEQARAMIKQGIPVRDFLGHYETQYQKVMSQKPARSAWDYDKNMSIISVFNMLLERIKKEGYDENLLAFISCFGPRRVAVNLMGQARESGNSSFSFGPDCSDARQTDEITWLDRLWNDRLAFQVMTGQLESLCVLKRNRDNEGTIVSISLHDSITRWRFETLTKDMREKWIFAAAYALSKCLPEIIDQKSQMKFLPLVRHFHSNISRCMEPQSLEAPGGKFCHDYGTLMTRFAKLYLNSGYTVEGESVFLQALSYQKCVQISSWPKGRPTLLLLKGFAIMLSKNGKMEDAAETTESLHNASKEQLGPEDEVTRWAAGRLPAVRDTKHRNANDERRAIVASRGGKLSSSIPKLTSNNPLLKTPRHLIHGSDESYWPQTTFTRLTLAGFSGDIGTIQLELDSGVDISGDHHPDFPLDLKSGINLTSSFGGAALQAASSAGHTEVVDMLLNYGADVNAITYAPTVNLTWGTALIAASHNGCSAVVNTLLKRAVDVNMKYSTSGSALYAASCQGHVAVVKTLLNHGADINDKSYDDFTALYGASSNGLTGVVELLLKNKADIDVCDESNATPLHLASYNGHIAVVEELLSHGASVDAHTRSFGTALQIAAWKGHQSIVWLLLNKGADINAQHGKLSNALYCAAGNGFQSLVELLLISGADVNAAYLTNGTPLQDAILNCHLRKVELLIENGADVNARSDQGTPLQIASWEGYVDLVDLLKGAGAHDDDILV